MAQTDREVLLVLYRSTNGPRWKKNRGWETRANLSKWHGVQVNDQGRVVRLSLTSNNLQGTIPEELGELTALEKLDLRINKISGTIPEELGKLTALEKLDLGINNLSGPIPAELGHLTALRYLVLWGNQLSGPIPQELGALSKLELLSLCKNQLTGPIPPQLGNLASLKDLYLRINKLNGPIPLELGNLEALRELYLSENKLSGPIPDALGDLHNLETLWLHDNQLTGTIPAQLGALKKLTWLKLSCNQLSGTIPEELGKLTALEELDLSSNNLSGPIPKELGALIKLEELYLCRNGLTGTVPLGIWKLPHVQQMDISDNLLTQFTDPDQKTTSTHEVLKFLDKVERKKQTKHERFVNTDGNPWEFPPAAVGIKGRESIRRYYNTWEQCNFRLIEIHALKVVFVGASGAGKTSLARSIRKGRGDRTPEIDENRRSTVGVDLFNHELRNGTECKIYDVAGQISYYGLHQYFLTERAVYVIVWDATRFEGLIGKDLDQAIHENILEWVSLLHMRTPVCTVMLVASHYDMLVGTTRENNEQLFLVVEKRFLELHAEWKSKRRSQNAKIDERMTVLPGVFPVSCMLESESRSTMDDGLQAVENALSKQASVASRIPPSWAAAREVLEEVGSAHGDSSGDAGSDRRRPWELLPVIHEAFKASVEQRRKEEHPEPWLSCLQDVGIRDSMEGAIETRAFSGTLISHGVFIVLDVMWLAGVLKPILDHKGVIVNNEGRQAFANRALTSAELLCWANELVGRGILRKGFARFLWNMDGQGIVRGEDSHEKCPEPAEFEKILEELGVTIPLPGQEDERGRSTARTEVEWQGNGVDDGPPRDDVDFLVIMRLPVEPVPGTRENLESAREAALPSRDSSGRGSCGLKAVFQFDHAGAPHGLPERVMALSHKIGILSSTARWRLGGLFLLHETGGKSGSSCMILEYDTTQKTFFIEALGQTALHFEAIGFVISALFHVASAFPGVGWTGWMECGLRHDGQKMYHLAPSDEKQNHKPGSLIIPLIPGSRSEKWTKQGNQCGRQGQEVRGSCTIDPDLFGNVVNMKKSESERRRSWCRMAFDYVLEPSSGKILSSSLALAVGFFIATTTIDNSKRVTLSVCFGFAGFCLLVAVVAALVFVTLKIEEGKRNDEADRAGQRDPSSLV